MTEIPNSKPIVVIEYWNLVFYNAPLIQRTHALRKDLKSPLLDTFVTTAAAGSTRRGHLGLHSLLSIPPPRLLIAAV